MAVRFTGVLSRAPASSVQADRLKPGHMVWPFDPPHVGLVLRMPKWQPGRDMLEPYLDDIGILGADWALIAYETWSGPVDYFQRYGQVGADRLESISQYDQKAQRLYQDLMERFGLGEEADDFAPLRKGFWG